jgi:alkylation response protein AidB-like acyl-CoA dehydrogenase
MDFGLSDEQEQLRDQARDLLAHECPTKRVREAMANGSGHDTALWRTFADAGWLGIVVPEAFGGAGLGLLDAVVVLGELGRVVAPGPFVASSIGAAIALREGGTKKQQQEWLPRIASGDAIGTLALAEPDEPRFDAAGVTQRARAGRGGGYRLDGDKVFVDGANVARLLLVGLRTGARRTPARGGDAWDGVGLFAVPRESKGVGVDALVTADETRRTCEVRLRGVEAGKDALLPRAGKTLGRVVDACAVAVAADSLGGAERALELATDYVKVREQFGRPVGSFQAVQHLAAESVAKIEPARALLWYAAWAWDERPKEAPLAAAMAKAACGDVYRAVSRTAIEMFGGVGFTFENDMHLYFKRALANAAAFGDSTLQRERVASLAGF